MLAVTDRDVVGADEYKNQSLSLFVHYAITVVLIWNILALAGCPRHPLSNCRLTHLRLTALVGISWHV